MFWVYLEVSASHTAFVGGCLRSDAGESFTRGSAKTGGRERDT